MHNAVELAQQPWMDSMLAPIYSEDQVNEAFDGFRAKVSRTYRMRSVVLKPEMPALWGQKGGIVKFFALEHDTEFLGWSTKICNHCHLSFLGRNDSNARHMESDWHEGAWFRNSSMLVAQRKPKFNMLRLMNAKPWNIRKKTSWATGFSSQTVIRLHTVRSKHIKSVFHLIEYYDIYIYIPRKTSKK